MRSSDIRLWVPLAIEPPRHLDMNLLKALEKEVLLQLKMEY
jgi:hypothetical protein